MNPQPEYLESTDNTITITYVYDALCGWCYGFSPVIEQLHAAMHEQAHFEVISGGMITGPRIGPIGEVAGYIQQAYKDVEQATGVKFGEKFLTETLAQGTAIFTSIPPAIALSVFKTHLPEQAVAFAGTLQKAIYYDGLQPLNLAGYAPYAAAYGVDGDQFVAAMSDPAFERAAKKEFAYTAGVGVNGFPTVLVQNAQRSYVVARGYLPYPALRARVKQAMDLLAQE
jgi:putative protein-disulfide isomerase